MSRKISAIILAILSIIGLAVLFVGAYGGIFKPDNAPAFYFLVSVVTLVSSSTLIESTPND